MALIKEKMTPIGVAASYWRVSMLTIDNERKEATFVMRLYYNKEATVSVDDMCVATAIFSKQGEEFSVNRNRDLFSKYFEDKGEVYKDIYTACYEYAKDNVEFFQDAADDPDELGLK